MHNSIRNTCREDGQTTLLEIWISFTTGMCKDGDRNIFLR
jgi:hypothetical protein